MSDTAATRLATTVVGDGRASSEGALACFSPRMSTAACFSPQRGDRTFHTLRVSFLLVRPILQTTISSSSILRTIAIYPSLLVHASGVFSGCNICSNSRIPVSSSVAKARSLAASLLSPSRLLGATRWSWNIATMTATCSTCENFLPGHLRRGYKSVSSSDTACMEASTHNRLPSPQGRYAP